MILQPDESVLNFHYPLKNKFRQEEQDKQVFDENMYIGVKFWGVSVAMDGKSLPGAGARHVVVLEIIGHLHVYDLIAHWIGDIFYNNEKCVEDGPSICSRIEKFINICNTKIIQTIETSFDKYLFHHNQRFRSHDYRLNSSCNNSINSDNNHQNVDKKTDDDTESQSAVDESELKREIEDSDW